MPEVALAAEVLPVRVLAPALDGVFVAERVDMLEVQQCCHQTRRQRRAPGGGDELRAPLVSEGLPVDQFGELDQLVPMVDQVEQLGAEQVVIGTLVDWLRTHRHLDAVCKELISIGPKSCNLDHRHSPRTPSIHAGWQGCSGRTI